MGTRKFRTPGSAQQSALESAKALMAERLKYEQWLDDLEAKKGSTPAKVFERVQKDYLDRLQNVVAQLGKFTETLERHAETLTGKLRDLQAMEEANEEEQAEQALRKQVGEISAADWESGSKRAQKELAKIKENQELIEAELMQIRALLGDADEEELEEQGTPANSKEFNELEFLSSVVGQSTAPLPAAKPIVTRPSGPTASPKAPTPAAGAVPAPAGSQPRTTPLPGTPAAAAPPPRVSNPSAPAAANQASPPAAQSTRASNPSAVAAAAPAADSAAPMPSSTPAPPAPTVPQTPTTAAATPPAASAPADTAPVLPPVVANPFPDPLAPVEEPPSAHRPTVATAQAKTLKCTECGTMNYATEWYCERCGAELTGA